MTSLNQSSRQSRSSLVVGVQFRLPPGRGPVTGRPVIPVDWFRRMPRGVTVHVRKREAE